MRYLGRITDWNDAKGFGFVTPNGGGGRVFLHVRALQERRRRPVDGDLVSYAPVRDARGRATATAVRFAGASAAPPCPPAAGPAGGSRRTWLGLAALAALAVGAWRGAWPVAVAMLYAGMSLATLVAYRRDKAAARAGGWRIPENTLHLLALLGGWPGALVAQDRLRHKSRKARFQAVFWCTVVLNCAALGWWLRAAAHA